jgi:phosphopantothenoylcysteine decarboxylase/phosphopantothenate--cysteine ligase
MGVAIAEAAWRRGASVTLVAGPLEVAVPSGVRVERVETTSEMTDAIGRLLPEKDILIMAAAPADFRPARAQSRKIKKAEAPAALELETTPDILRSTRAQRRKGAIVVGFALETDDALANGRGKLEDKALDLIVVNDATEPGAGFGGDTNRVTLIDRDGRQEALPLASKLEVADAILDRVEQLARGR